MISDCCWGMGGREFVKLMESCVTVTLTDWCHRLISTCFEVVSLFEVDNIYLPLQRSIYFATYMVVDSVWLASEKNGNFGVCSIVRRSQPARTRVRVMVR